MRRLLWIIVFACSVVLNLSFLAGYGFQRLAEPRGFVEDELELSAEQRAWIDRQRGDFLRRIEDDAGHMIGRHTDLLDAIAQEPPDPAVIEARLGELRSTQLDMQKVVVAYLLAEGKILTSEQRAQLFSALKKRMQAQGHGPRWLAGSSSDKPR
jgi:Spy/CpxP family protein refolding chaperone